MNKVKKISIVIIFFAIIIFVCIRIYDYSILSKISKTTKKLKNSGEPYFVKNTEINPDGKIYIREFYRENDIAVSKNTTKEGDTIKEKSFTWMTRRENEFCNTYYADYNQEIDGLKYLTCVARNEEKLISEEFERTGFVNFYSYEFPTISFESEMNFFEKVMFEIKNKFFYPSISTEEYKGIKCYTFTLSKHMKYYVDKDTCFTVAVEHLGSNENEIYITEYEYLNEAPEGVYEKPNPEDFDKVMFADYASNTIDTNNKLIAEKPISGTELEAGEQLVENIELKDNEELNFLNLTSDESGIINFEIYNLETYNKFREKYSGLRELTEEDFEYYYVVIAYKINQKLNYIEQFASKESWRFNFVVSSENAKNDTILLAVIPTESGNRNVDFVESAVKLKIDAEEAMNIANNECRKIEEYFDLEFETYIGYSEDCLKLLTKEMFSEMEYIKTPIVGEERVCWKLHYRVNNHEKINYMELYVDAITGDVIGAKNYYYK